MNSYEIRRKFIEFFQKREHAVLPSASLVPENDPTVLFTTAGMQPLIPYLLGQKHPSGNKLVNVQKCVRTQDIEEVGDNTHDTFFEMLGNWSLGTPEKPNGVGIGPEKPDGLGTGYFKKEAISWSYEFLTNKDEGLGLDLERLYVTCFQGDEDAPQDTESAEIWKSLGLPENRIYFLGKEKNWWAPGANGPCGPDTEMFYDLVGNLNLKSKEEFLKADQEQKIVEIWNDVFMEYEQKDGKVVNKLAQKNVDTGAGLERLSMVLQSKDNIFETDLFSQSLDILKKEFPNAPIRSLRIIADHVRTSAFLMADGVRPGNKEREYILRRLMRRALFQAYQVGARDSLWISSLLGTYVSAYHGFYKELEVAQKNIELIFTEETAKFYKTLDRGMRIFEETVEKHTNLSGNDAFLLVTTYGFPLELIEEKAKELGITVDIENYKKEMEKHQVDSRAGSQQKFKGGLLDDSEQSTRYHTATHMLHRALKMVLGESVFQKGSNITPERLRFDFSYDKKMTPEEIKKIEDIINEKIKENLPVIRKEMTVAEAKELGAMGLFTEKYGDTISVYQVGEGANRFSIEICGGPHVASTDALGKRFKIIKEEAVASGVRRIKAILENGTH